MGSSGPSTQDVLSNQSALRSLQLKRRGPARFLILVFAWLGMTSLASASSDPTYEPPCDTTRAERDAIRAEVSRRLIEAGEFGTRYDGVIRRLADVDPQGDSLGYQFPDQIGTVAPFLYQMPMANDAILYLYCNPPSPGPAYWGTTPYLVSYSYVGALKGAATRRLEPNAELGDSLNQLRIASTAPTGELPWGHTSAVITTPDEASAQAVRAALGNAGFPARAVNVQVVPSGLSDRISFGTGFGSSVFVTGFRYRAWKDADASESYADYEEPVVYLTGRKHPPVPLATPDRLRRGGLRNEDGLAASIQSLASAVKQGAEAEGFRFVGQTAMQPNPIMDPENCFRRFDQQTSRTCFQGSQDISYGGAAPEMAPGGMHILVGAIHSRTGLARYASIGFLRDNLDTGDLAGSAQAWKPEILQRDRDSLFVLRVSRRCADEAGQAKAPCLVYPKGESHRYIERAVLEAASKTGPAFQDLQPAIVLQFEPR